MIQRFVSDSKYCGSNMATTYRRVGRLQQHVLILVAALLLPRSIHAFGVSCIPPHPIHVSSSTDARTRVCSLYNSIADTNYEDDDDDDEEISNTADDLASPPVVDIATASDTTTTATNLPQIGSPAPCAIKVIGVGGGGGNAVHHMVQGTLSKGLGVAFCAINTDAQALSTAQSPPTVVVNIGQRTTRGLGAGGDPATGTQAALESVKELEELCRGVDMVFITAGMVRL